jgi:hypothetical protein
MTNGGHFIDIARLKRVHQAVELNVHSLNLNKAAFRKGHSNECDSIRRGGFRPHPEALMKL